MIVSSKEQEQNQEETKQPHQNLPERSVLHALNLAERQLKRWRSWTNSWKSQRRIVSRLWHYRWEELYKYKGHIYDLFWSFIMPYIMQIHTIYCQAQFRLASSVPVQLGTEISLNISVTPTRASIFEPLLDYLGT